MKKLDRHHGISPAQEECGRGGGEQKVIALQHFVIE
jgi:hypothetical protein